MGKSAKNKSDKFYGLVYKITNKVNGKIYIGQTKNSLWYRKSAHKSASFTKKGQYSINIAMREYGWENFEWDIIDTAENRNELMEKEMYWIDFYDSYNIEKGCNMTLGGEGTTGSMKDQKIRKLISDSKIGKLQSEAYDFLPIQINDVIEIKKMLMSNVYNNKQIAEIFNVDSRTISNIKYKVRWSHVEVDGFEEWHSQNCSKRKKQSKPLSDELVRKAKEMFVSTDIPQSEIARTLNIDYKRLNQIFRGKSFTYIVVDGFEDALHRRKSG